MSNEEAEFWAEIVRCEMRAANRSLPVAERRLAAEQAEEAEQHLRLLQDSGFACVLRLED